MEQDQVNRRAIDRERKRSKRRADRTLRGNRDWQAVNPKVAASRVSRVILDRLVKS